MNYSDLTKQKCTKCDHPIIAHAWNNSLKKFTCRYSTCKCKLNVKPMLKSPILEATKVIPCHTLEFRISKLADYLHNNKKASSEKEAMTIAISLKLLNGMIIDLNKKISDRWVIGAEDLYELMATHWICRDDIPMLKTNFPSFYRYAEDLNFAKEKMDIRRFDGYGKEV